MCQTWQMMKKNFAHKKSMEYLSLYTRSVHETTTEIFRGSHAVLFLWEVGKVYIFWEGHKVLRNLHHRFDLYYIGQIYSGDFAKICSLLRIYELYKLCLYKAEPTELPGFDTYRKVAIINKCL